MKPSRGVARVCRPPSNTREATGRTSEAARHRRAAASLAFAAVLGLAACEPRNDPEIVAHRALGFTVEGEENIPANVLAAFENGFGAEIDLRSDGDGCAPDEDPDETGCFDLGHDRSNGHELSEVLELLSAGWQDHFANHTLVLDIANDTGNIVSTNLMDYLFRVMPALGLEPLPLLLQSSAFEDIEVLRYAFDRYLEEGAAPLNIRLGVTYFANPELPLPDYVDMVVCNIYELSSLPYVPQEVAVFGVDSQGAWKQALFATSRVAMVITDYPYRFEEAP